MNIKTLTNQNLTAHLDTKMSVDRTIKSGSTTDREGNGQGHFQNEKKQRPPMTEDELQLALKNLSELPAFKELNLSLEVVRHGDRALVLLKESDGKIIRRIPEEELWTLPEVKSYENSQSKGQLLRKSA